MTGLVAGFNVEIDEVVAAGRGGRVCAQQGIDGGLSLAFEVGVVEACGARDVDDTQAGIVSDAANEVHGGDDGAATDLVVEALGEGHHLGAVATTPRPDAGGHVAAFSRANRIYIM